MNKIITAIFLSIGMLFAGCKSIPSTDKTYSTAKAVGIAAATVANMTKIDDTSRNAVIDIVNEVEGCIPETNQTFEAAWTPIAEKHVQKLLDEGKINEGQKTLILGAFNVAVKGIDYLFSIRFPKIAQYTELVEAAVHGFCNGFLSNFKPANLMCSGCALEKSDKDAYEYLCALQNIKQ